MATVDYTASITAIQTALTALTAQMAAGTVPIGVQSMSVAGRSISYTNPKDGIDQLVDLLNKLITLQSRQSNGFFSRTTNTRGGYR